MPRPAARTFVLGVLAFAALLAGYRWNAWGAAGPDFFAGAQKDTEGLVLGRMAAARERGLLAHAGLLGFVGDRRDDLVTYDTAELWQAYSPFAQEWIYLNETPFRSYGVYLSHSGLQGTLFALLDRAFAFLAPAARLELFFAGAAALVAALHAALAVYLWRELGPLAAACALATMLASPWMTAFARNLYFSLWLYWLPPLALGLALARGQRPGEGRRVFLASALGFLPRFLSGFEYVTETVALAAAPILYFSLRDALGWRAFLARTLAASGGCLLALAASLALLTLQIRAVTGSFAEAREHIAFAVARRATGDAGEMPPVYAAALQSDLGEVVRFYLADPFDRDALAKRAPLDAVLARSHGTWIAAALAAAAWIALRARWMERERRRRALGLAAAVVATLAGVLAWLTVFKAHSYIHTHVNPLLWHLGFLVLAAALVGLAARDALGLAVRSLAHARRA